MSRRSNVRRIPALIAQLYQTVQTLQSLFPDRPFTPDGHLVGSIGEVVAADTYGLKLQKNSTPGFDARTPAGKTVEVKLTGGAAVVVSSVSKTPEFLLVLKLNEKTGFTEVYNGEFPHELWKQKVASKRLVKSLRVRELTQLKPKKRLSQKNTLEALNALFTRNTDRAGRARLLTRGNAKDFRRRTTGIRD